MEVINVQAARGNYPVLIGAGLLKGIGDVARRAWSGNRAVIVTDSNVAPLYLESCRASLTEKGFLVRSAVVPAGERSKTPSVLSELYSAFYQGGISRTDGIIALGGGVVGDLAGFAAATFLRGVPLIQAPTTLLAQVDASIGGKTGIDLPFAKNVVGAFYSPKAVVADLQTLNTLEPRRVSEGMAEVIKYGCILDAELFESIEADTFCFSSGVPRCARIKAELVSRDEHDLEERILLNFGHTIGHAIEQATGFTDYTHGEAVALGMVTALKIGEKLGVSDPQVLHRLLPALKRWNLPVEASIPVERLLPALGCDKKKRGDVVRFVLVKRMGESVLHNLALPELRQLAKEAWSND